VQNVVLIQQTMQLDGMHAVVVDETRELKAAGCLKLAHAPINFAVYPLRVHVNGLLQVQDEHYTLEQNEDGWYVCPVAGVDWVGCNDIQLHYARCLGCADQPLGHPCE